VQVMRKTATAKMVSAMLETSTSLHSNSVRRVSGLPVNRSSSSLFPH